MAEQAIFTVERFEFPYLYKFPGQSSDERILFVTRESDVILIFRQVLTALTAGIIFIVGYAIAQMLRSVIGNSVVMIELLSAVIAVGFGVAGFWWVTTLWRKSIAIITNKRLSKFIYTTPWNRHNLSLPLDMIVDTGAYSKGFLQA